MFVAAAVVSFIDRSNRDGIKKNAKVDAEYEKKRFDMILNDIRGLHLKIQDHRKVNNER